MCTQSTSKGVIDSFGEEGMQLVTIIMQHARDCAKNSNSILIGLIERKLWAWSVAS